ncbi:MAG: fibronectin type III domain-containing protein [Balneolaceae bacterium]
MSQIILLQFTFLFLFSACSNRADFYNSYKATPFPDRINLTITDDPATSITITWRTDTATEKSLAKIAIATPHPDFVNDADSLISESVLHESKNGFAYYHTVTFKNLDPETQYAYKVGGENYWSEWNHFTTASAKNEPFSFIYFGDAQNDIKSLWSRAIRTAYTTMPNARFMLHAGDLVDQRGKYGKSYDDEWGEWFEAGGWIHSVLPSIPTPGNHEYIKDENDEYIGLGSHWKAVFNLPVNGPGEMDELTETVYYIDYQGVRFISLNTQSMNLSEKSAQIQAEWLINVLETNPHKWTIVTHHHPVIAAGKDREHHKMLNKYIRPIYEKYNVDLVLQGHDHTYARGRNLPSGLQHFDRENGTMYVVSVSGPKMYSLTENWMDKSAENTQLFQIISIENDTLSFEAYTVTGELFDSFTITKNPAGINDISDISLAP